MISGAAHSASARRPPGPWRGVVAVPLSSLLFVVTALLWVRSYERVEYVWHTRPSGGWSFSSEDGTLRLLRGTELRSAPGGSGRFRDRSLDAWVKACRQFVGQPLHGFEYHPGDGHGVWGVGVPYWVPLLLTAVWPVWQFARRDRPGWMRYAAAAAVGFWPFGVLLLDAPDFDPEEAVGVLVFWCLAAVVAVGVLCLRDHLRSHNKRPGARAIASGEPRT